MSLLTCKMPKGMVLGLLSLYLVLVVPTTVSFKYEELLGFAVREMEVKVPVKLPKVIYVTRDEMIEVMKRLVNDPEVDYPYADINGLFQAGTDFVRVTSDLYKVKLESVTLHEIVHYIQEQAHGQVPDDGYFGPGLQMMREMQAYRIQEMYEKIYNN